MPQRWRPTGRLSGLTRFLWGVRFRKIQLFEMVMNIEKAFRRTLRFPESPEVGDVHQLKLAHETLRTGRGKWKQEPKSILVSPRDLPELAADGTKSGQQVTREGTTSTIAWKSSQGKPHSCRFRPRDQSWCLGLRHRRCQQCTAVYHFDRLQTSALRQNGR